MTKHMIRLFIEPPNGNAQNAINNWVQNHNEWTDDPVEHTLSEANTALDGTGDSYLRGEYRFVQEEPPAELMDALESRLETFQGGVWYRIGYHECDHDEDSGSGCSWETTRESDTVPDDIPTLE